jgi:hypothetical protein
MFNAASADMVDIHLSVLFTALRSTKRYLRIQVPIRLNTERKLREEIVSVLRFGV